MNIKNKLVLSLIALLPFAIGATDSTSNAQNIASTLSQIMMPLMTIIILIALPLLIFKVLSESILKIVKD